MNARTLSVVAVFLLTLVTATRTEAGFDNRGGSDGPVPWGNDIPASSEDAPCILSVRPPDIGVCAMSGAGGITSPVNGSLAVLSCVLNAVNQWQIAQLQCLESQVSTRAKKVLWPVEDTLRPVHMFLRDIDILRDEVYRIVCQWPFSPRVSVFRDMYVQDAPTPWCRDTYVRLFGDGSQFRNAGLHELAAWMSTTTENLIRERTAGDGDHSAESTWDGTAVSVSMHHVENFGSPGEAIRFAATTDADRLRAKNNALQLQAQRMLVSETLRSYHRQKETDRDAWAMFMEAAASAAFRTQNGPPSMFKPRD